MGIDVYLRWKGQTEAEEKAQYTGFDPTKGRVGYLREAYHGGPYATRVLVPETWGDNSAVQIPAATLRARLDAAKATVRERYKRVYNETDTAEVEASYEAFVALAEQKEAELGEPCTVLNSY